MRREAAKMSAFSTAVTDTPRFQPSRIPRSQRTSWPVVVAEIDDSLGSLISCFPRIRRS